MLGAGGAAKKPYIDDVFSTYLYKGTGSALTINNGINESGGGALTWIKRRNSAQNHFIQDTTRGVTKVLRANSDEAESTDSSAITAFNNNGFTLGTDTSVNSSGDDYSSWTFRKAPGFFDVVTWTGNGSARTISHKLGCIPGVILVKRLDSADRWQMYHNSLGIDSRLYMNLNWAASSSSSAWWNATLPTASVFSIGTDSGVNANNGEYLAYLFGGGESDAATARSVEMDGIPDHLTLAASTDFAFGTGDFTIECWAKMTDPSSYRGIFQLSGTTGGLTTSLASSLYVAPDGAYNDRWEFAANGAVQNGPTIGHIVKDQWYHVALVRHSSTTKLYIDGIPIKTIANDTTNYSYENLAIGGMYSTNYLWQGSISNFRLVKGTAVYTSAFRPPTEPLTNITNTKILCCNNSSTTGSTVTPGTITANGTPTASTDSPFYDPASFVFGENEDQNAIKCGSYVGNGSGTGPEINLGWEPQWILIKRTSAAGHWALFDSMRGITSGTDDYLYPSQDVAEYTTANQLHLTPTGFKIDNSGTIINGNTDKYIYVAIRRPDGYCGKPVETATSVFAMDTGNSDSGIPNFDSGFIVDYALLRQPAAADNMHSLSRLTGKNYLFANTSAVESDYSGFKWDSNEGWYDGSAHGSSYQSWMWKRHAGMDVVDYKSLGGTFAAYAHNLGKIPEMIWVKNRDSSSNDWAVYHKGLNGGSSPHGKNIKLNTAAAEVTNTDNWANTAPTSSHFFAGGASDTNSGGNQNYIAMLFASVDGISKVGYFDGTGNTNNVITTNFQVRFLLMKRVDTSSDWWVFDSLRGIGGSNNCKLEMNNTDAQNCSSVANSIATSSTGFTLGNGTDSTWFNVSSGKYIYYAHA